MPDTRVVHVLHSVRTCEDMHREGQVTFLMDEFETEHDVYQLGDFALITAMDGCVQVGAASSITGRLVIFTVT